jgi:TetR/AcrR family transcriptional regulator, fatty acid metabolism regulator protein
MRSENETAEPEKLSFIEAARRAQIIECAIDAIAELGFGQASLAQIARRAGISTGVISYHFDGKDQLIRAVVRHVYETGTGFIRPRVDLQSGPRAALGTFIAASVGFTAAHPNHSRAIANIVLSGRTGLFDRSVDQGRRDGFRAILESGQRAGVFRRFDVGAMVATIIGALNMMPQLLSEQPDLDLEAYGRELVELFDRATRRDDL